MQESRFERRKLRYQELENFQSSRKSNGRTKTGLMNLYSKKFKDDFDARLHSVQSQDKQHPILNYYSKTMQLNSKPKRTLTSQIVHPRSTRTNVRKDLGHDLDQLTKHNQHELDLSPHPSLTIMVQPNKIDYSQRSIACIITFCTERIVNVVTLCFSTA